MGLNTSEIGPMIKPMVQVNYIMQKEIFMMAIGWTIKRMEKGLI